VLAKRKWLAAATAANADNDVSDEDFQTKPSQQRKTG
jgi:hypothetical protein